MHNFCFNRTKFIPINESECSVYMNAKYSDRVDVCIYMSQASNQKLFFDMRTLHKYREFPAVCT